MSEAVRIERVGQALWPEVTGMAAAAGVQMIAAAIDERWEGQERPIAQTVASAGILGGSAYAISVNAAPEFFRGVLYLGVGMGVINLSRWLIERAKAQPDRVVGGMDIFALVPRRSGAVNPRKLVRQMASPINIGMPLQLQAQPVGALLVPEIPGNGNQAEMVRVAVVRDGDL
ncbi:MAG: hypothetical protein DDT26_02282 [Dehalococcoidia bacterium]|nr:hypothetical protein [Chloroflexota bacterium]